MTEHKFTDEELRKCMECCIKALCLGDCEDLCCPAITKHGCRFYLRTDDDYEGVIQMEMLKDALDLIKRQKAEIETLREEVLNMATDFGEIEIRSEKIKAEAVKEFAERLKERLIEGGIYPVLVKNSINDLVKEMTEGKS